MTVLYVTTSPNGWITPEIKLAWWRVVAEHPRCPAKLRSIIWFFDGHYSNFHDYAMLDELLGKDVTGAPVDITAGAAEMVSEAGPVSGTTMRSEPKPQQHAVVFPSHCTHGLQQLDNLIIALTKKNVKCYTKSYRKSRLDTDWDTQRLRFTKAGLHKNRATQIVTRMT